MKRIGRGRPSRSAIHQNLQQQVEELRRRYGGLPEPQEAESIWNEIWYSEAHASTAIEGNTLVLKEVEALLRDGKAVGDKQLKDYLEVQGYASAARWVYEQAFRPGSWETDRLLTVQEVRHVHSLAMEAVWGVVPHPDAHSTEGPGNWRLHNIRPFSRGMTPPDFTDIPARISDWVAGVNAIPADVLPIAEAVAKRHVEFERIHPFLDGNGRAGRLLMNLTLVRLGYPPAIIHKRLRSQYLRALQTADSGDVGPLGELLARAITDNLVRFILPTIAGPVKLVPLTALASPDISLVALRQAAARGRLKTARNDAGYLLSSKEWLDSYLASRALSGRRTAGTDH